jgi:hypothetical protein
MMMMMMMCGLFTGAGTCRVLLLVMCLLWLQMVAACDSSPKCLQGYASAQTNINPVVLAAGNYLLLSDVIETTWR